MRERAPSLVIGYDGSSVGIVSRDVVAHAKRPVLIVPGKGTAG